MKKSEGKKSLIFEWFSNFESVVTRYERINNQSKRAQLDHELSSEQTRLLEKMRNESFSLDSYRQEFEVFQQRASKENKSEFFQLLLAKAMDKIMREFAAQQGQTYEKTSKYAKKRLVASFSSERVTHFRRNSESKACSVRSSEVRVRTSPLKESQIKKPEHIKDEVDELQREIDKMLKESDVEWMKYKHPNLKKIPDFNVQKENIQKIRKPVSKKNNKISSSFAETDQGKNFQLKKQTSSPKAQKKEDVVQKKDNVVPKKEEIVPKKPKPFQNQNKTDENQIKKPPQTAPEKIDSNKNNKKNEKTVKSVQSKRSFITSRSQNPEMRTSQTKEQKFLSPDTAKKEGLSHRANFTSPLQKMQPKSVKAPPNTLADITLPKEPLKPDSKHKLRLPAKNPAKKDPIKNISDKNERPKKKEAPKNDLPQKLPSKTAYSHVSSKVKSALQKASQKPQILSIFESVESVKPDKNRISPGSTRVRLPENRKPQKKSKNISNPSLLSKKNKENSVCLKTKTAKNDLKNVLGVLLNITKTVDNHPTQKETSSSDLSPVFMKQKYEKLLDDAMKLSVELTKSLEDNCDDD